MEFQSPQNILDPIPAGPRISGMMPADLLGPCTCPNFDRCFLSTLHSLKLRCLHGDNDNAAHLERLYNLTENNAASSRDSGRRNEMRQAIFDVGMYYYCECQPVDLILDLSRVFSPCGVQHGYSLIA